MNKKYFLATTALEEFWDIEKPIVFLGEWCMLYERRPFLEAFDGHLMESPFPDIADVRVVYQNVDEIYERILPLLAETLNSMHGKSHSLRYWRIVIGPWLQTYIPVMYDRYEHLIHALENYPNLTTTVLSEKSFIVPADTLDFICSLSEDSFNLQIYSKILLSLGKKFPSKELQFEQNPQYDRLTGGSWKQRLVGACTDLYESIANKFFSASIVFKNSYFPKAVEFRLLVAFFGRAFSMRGLESKINQSRYSSDMRKLFKKFSYGRDGFSKCLSEILFSDIPACFVEDFQSITDEGKTQYPNSPKTIFSANSWYYDEIFKSWTAACAENGSLLLGTPHGGNYGVLLNMPAVQHETAIVDYYYSWGWDRNDCSAQVIPMPAPKLMGINKMGASNNKNGILWVTTKDSRYLSEPFLLPKYFLEYLHWHKRFAEALPNEIIPEILVRAHYLDYGWGIVSRIKNIIPDLKLDTWEIPFQESLENCRIYVCDHLSTTFVEALAANKPAILFWDPQANELRPEAQHYFDLLRNNGILLDTPEAAAEAVNSVYVDVESWWNDPARQEAVNVFVEQFARTSPNAIDLWTDELHRITASK